MEVIFMAYSSWSMHTTGYPARFDFVIAGDPRSAGQLEPLCRVVETNIEPDSLRQPGKLHECFFFPYPDRSHEQYGFFGINQAAFLLDEKIGSMLEQYDLVIKSDFDVFILPSLIDFFPPPGTVVFGRQLFVLVSEVSEKIKNVARDMGLTVRDGWKHNTGMTSYGPYPELRRVAEVMLSATRFMLENTFEQRPGGGPVLDYGGFPGWCLYVVAMYAQEIAANHVLEEFVVDPRMDAWSDLKVPADDLLLVHCQQGAERFNKEVFFQTRYLDVDLSQLNTSVARDCVTFLAAGAFRSMLGEEPQRQANSHARSDGEL